MKYIAILALSFFLSACVTSGKFRLVKDIASEDGDCKDITPVPEQIFSLSPLYKEAIASGKKHGNENVLVLFDIDNTLLAAHEQLGSDQWFSWIADNKVDFGNENIDEFACLLNAQKLLYQRGAMRVTGTDITKTILDLQQKGFLTAALTSRGPDVQAVTLRDLYAAGIQFTEHSPHGWFAKSLPKNKKIRYEYGVFLTSGENKGDMANLLLEETGLQDKIKRVLFIDDKTKHVCRVQNKVKDHKAVAFHYPVEDKNVAPVQNNEPKALEQLQQDWQSFLSDLSCNSDFCNVAYNSCQSLWNKY